MPGQLDLLPPTPGDDWRLDAATIESGRRGLAKARAALDAARARLAAEPDTDHQHPAAA